MTNIISVITYYLSSFCTLVRRMNFLAIPLLLVRRPVPIRLDNGRRFLVASLMDVWTLKEVVMDRQYEQYRTVQRSDVVVDIGASIGDFSVMTSRKARKVYAFEKDEKRAALMRKNLEINQCRNVDLTVREVHTLNDIFAENKIAHCDFLKIDCEGGEYEIFRQSDTVVLGRIDFIAIEVHLFNEDMRVQYAGLKERLTDSGFILEEVPNRVHTYIKFLFARRESV